MMLRRRSLACMLLLASLVLWTGCTRAQQAEPADTSAAPPAQEVVPDWAQGAVFYQIFPERFRNGDPSNDPPRASLERPIEGRVPESWAVTPWTSDWYAQADWEEEMGGFYESVFDRRYGGDLQGVIDRLGYLDSLGIDAIYFNPLFWARSLHKYDGNTFHHIDPHFGPDPEGDFEWMEGEDPADPSTWTWTRADSLFLELLERAHDRELRVIIDGVFNHTGRDFFAFRDLEEHQEDSPYRDWYVVHRFDDPATPDTNEFDYQGWWGVETLPEFADNADGSDLHPGPKEYVFAATRRWMDPDGDPSDGIDGWRLDVTEDVPLGFWKDWHGHIRSINPEAYTVSEIWQNAAPFIEETGFSATMNYWAFAFPVKAFLIDGALTPSAFAQWLRNRRVAYAEPVRLALQNLIDSHDTPRLASMIVNRDPEDLRLEQVGYDREASPREVSDYDVSKPGPEERRLRRLVALFQMTYVGAPMIYYGTEAGMWGADDPDDRKPMVWPDLDYDVEDSHPFGHARPADSVAFDHDLFDYYRALIALRDAHPALRRGDTEVLHTGDAQELFAFSRSLDEDALVIVLNCSDEAHSLRVGLPEDLRGSYEEAFLSEEGEPRRLQQDAEALLIEIPERAGLVFRRVR